MTSKALEFGGYNADDITEVPMISELLKHLHLMFPGIFPPVLVRPLVIGFMILSIVCGVLAVITLVMVVFFREYYDRDYSRDDECGVAEKKKTGGDLEPEELVGLKST